MDKETKLLAAGVLAAVGIVICAWSLRFWGDGILSSTTGDWAAFGSFFGGLLGPFFSLATIVYLVWSFREQASVMNDQMKSMQRQTELMQEQVEKDRERDERDMLMNELRVLAKKVNELCEDPIDFVAIAEDFVPIYFGKDVEYNVIDRYMIDVNGYRLYGGLISVLGGLEHRAGLAGVQKFLDKCKKKRGAFNFDLLHVDYVFIQLIDLSFRALEHGARADVVKSITLPIFPHATSLFGLGRLSEGHYCYLQLLRDIPDEKTAWEEYVSGKFVSEFLLTQRTGLSEEQVEFKVQLDEENTIVEGYQVVERDSGQVWERERASVWKKVS